MTYTFSPAYPTPQHERSAAAIVDFFSHQPAVSAVLLTCSCARGKASRESCLDITVLVPPDLPTPERAGLEQAWEQLYQSEPVFAEQRQVGRFSQVDLKFHTGQFDPAQYYHGWTSGADAFELEVGNLVAYSFPLWECNRACQDLRARWLPYYGEDLRCARLDLVLRYCRNNLAHIPLFVPRGLVFQSFKRLYLAFEEYLQALFIARRTYPIAYDKWVREQVVEILRLPDLYPQLIHLLEVDDLESVELIHKAETIEAWIQATIEK
jgi:hypothetical protein